MKIETIETKYCDRCGEQKKFQIYSGAERAVLWENSHAELWDSSHAELSKFAAAHIHGEKVACKGGVQIKVPEIATMKEWCKFYGIEIKRGVAVVFKAVDDDYSTDNARSKGIFYTPGTKPVAPDWDGGKQECGGGLHFSPTPGHALDFNPQAKHFVACPVKVAGVKIVKNPERPSKIKAKGVCAPCWEVVDREGKPLRVT
jgi:hypothetical protein